MDHQAIIQLTADFIRQEFETDSSGHDWWHVYRVWKNALAIAQQEGANLFEVELGALLHDLDDWKFRETSGDDPCPRARAWLVSHGVEEIALEHICQVINEVSFKGAGVDTRPTTPEGQIVQDADRLDAIGAIGIGRAFAYGGSRGRPLHDPETAPVLHGSFEAYRTSKGATINHFYEKLLLLHERLNTPAAQQAGQQRHDFMLTFLEKFFLEWEGKDTADHTQPQIIDLHPYLGRLRTVQVVLAGEPLTFLFDTGGGQTLITPLVAEKLGGAASGRSVGYRMNGEQVTFEQVTAGPLQIGGEIIPFANLGIFDLMALLPPGIPELHGVLALDQFAHRPFTLELGNERIILETQTSLEERTKGMAPVPMRVASGVDGAATSVFAEVHGYQGHTGWFLLDSGCLEPVLVAPHTAAIFGLQQEPGREGNQPLDLEIGGLAPVRLEVKVKDLIYDGVLNAAFLENHTVTLDLENKNMWISR